MTEKIIVATTCGSLDEARRIAHSLVDSRLAACVAITSGTRSVYRWQGAVEESEECTLAIKSSLALFPALRTEIRRLHSYQTPEILALPVVDGDADYLAWMDESLRAPAP